MTHCSWERLRFWRCRSERERKKKREKERKRRGEQKKRKPHSCLKPSTKQASFTHHQFKSNYNRLIRLTHCSHDWNLIVCRDKVDRTRKTVRDVRLKVSCNPLWELTHYIQQNFLITLSDCHANFLLLFLLATFFLVFFLPVSRIVKIAQFRL